MRLEICFLASSESRHQAGSLIISETDLFYTPSSCFSGKGRRLKGRTLAGFKDEDSSLIRKCSTNVLILISKLMEFISLLLNIKPSFIA
jgi:hypothetical protein